MFKRYYSFKSSCHAHGNFIYLELRPWNFKASAFIQRHLWTGPLAFRMKPLLVSGFCYWQLEGGILSFFSFFFSSGLLEPVSLVHILYSEHVLREWISKLLINEWMSGPHSAKKIHFHNFIVSYRCPQIISLLLQNKLTYFIDQIVVTEIIRTWF